MITSPPLNVDSNTRVKPPLRFGGLGDAFSNVVGFIDGNRIVELISTDVFGMCIPRTSIEASMRPSGYRKDAARETAIREFSGLFLNTVAVGWLSYGLSRTLGNRANWHNPHGIPANAWISADSMEAFGSIYEHILADKTIQTPQEARQKFIRTILGSMASSSKKPSLIGMLKASEGLNQEARLAFLKPAFSDSPRGLQRIEEILQEHPPSLLPHADELDGLYSGKLSTPMLDGLIHHFENKTNPLDKQAMRRVVETLLQDSKITRYLSDEQLDTINTAPVETSYNQLLKLLPPRDQTYAKRLFTQKRLNLSLNELRYAEKEWSNLADRMALSGGLTDTIQLLDGKLDPLVRGKNGQPIMMTKNRKAVLKETKYFLEQYLDRAAHEAHGAGENWKLSVHGTLYGKPEQTAGQFWHRWIARAEDGLIPAAIKSKWAFTYVPIVLTIITSIAVAFYNNWLTQKKHGGRVISPIDGSMSGSAAPPAGPTSNPLPPPVAEMFMPPQEQKPQVSLSSTASLAQAGGPFAIFKNPVDKNPIEMGGVSA